MTHAQRNAAIIRKIAAYTARVTASPEAAKKALQHEREVIERKPKFDMRHTPA